MATARMIQKLSLHQSIAVGPWGEETEEGGVSKGIGQGWGATRPRGSLCLQVRQVLAQAHPAHQQRGDPGAWAGPPVQHGSGDGQRFPGQSCAPQTRHTPGGFLAVLSLIVEHAREWRCHQMQLLLYQRGKRLNSYFFSWRWGLGKYLGGSPGAREGGR